MSYETQNTALLNREVNVEIDNCDSGGNRHIFSRLSPELWRQHQPARRQIERRPATPPDQHEDA
jgi:hypothetical protein